MKRTTIARCAVAGVVLFSLFRIHQCAQDQDKHWDEVHEAEAKEKRERATERAAADAAQKRFEEGPVAAPGLDPAEVTRLTADRQSALKLYHSIDGILGRAAWSFTEGRHGYCEFYVDTVLGIHIDTEHAAEAEKLMLKIPDTDEDELERDRKLEAFGNKALAYEERVATCESGIETGTLQMPSKVDLETRRYQAKQEIAEIDRRLTNPQSVPEPSTQTPQGTERPVDISQSLVTPQASASIGAPAPESAAPAPPIKPTSGVLCNGPVEVRQNGELAFKNLPGDRLKFTFDHDAWLPLIHREPDGTQTLIMRSIKSGIQTKCDIQWEVAQ